MSHLYGKVFGSLYEGSMLGAGVHVFALWPYCLARADDRLCAALERKGDTGEADTVGPNGGGA